MSAKIRWKAIPKFPDYEVSDDGRVRRITPRFHRNGKRLPYEVPYELSPGITKGGYRQVTLCRMGELGQFKMNRLVCEAFHGPAPTAQHVAAHWDGNPANNHYSNLRWATPLENAQDRDRHGRTTRGESCHTARLCEEDVREIRRRAAHMPKYGRNIRLAAEFKVAPSVIKAVVLKNTWKHVT